MENFTPLSATVGGLMIGSAAALLLWLNGRIAGISGILTGAVEQTGTPRGWRWMFLAGLVGGALLALLLGSQPLAGVTRMSGPVVIAAGLLVGFGTRLGSGCTSGHGVCGLARFSVRSLAATLTFMGTGAATVFVVRHVLGG
jgi:uncharacterized membrane protein YedE/YeeE